MTSSQHVYKVRPRKASWKKTGGVQTTIYNSLTRFAAACGTLAAACDGFGIARNTPTTFDVFLWLQVTNVDVSFLHSALARDVQPNRKQVCYFLRIHNFCVGSLCRMSLIALRFRILCKSCEMLT